MRVLTEQITIQASRPDIWTALEDFGGVAKWAPFMKRSKLVGSQSTGVGTRRIMHHSLGFNFEEVVTQWADGEGYSFEVYRAPYPMANVHEKWSLTSQDENSIVTTRVSYRMQLGGVGRILDSMAVQYIVRREMRSGLRGLKTYVESAATANRPLHYLK